MRAACATPVGTEDSRRPSGVGCWRRQVRMKPRALVSAGSSIKCSSPPRATTRRRRLARSLECRTSSRCRSRGAVLQPRWRARNSSLMRWFTRVRRLPCIRGAPRGRARPSLILDEPRLRHHSLAERVGGDRRALAWRAARVVVIELRHRDLEAREEPPSSLGRAAGPSASQVRQMQLDRPTRTGPPPSMLEGRS